MPAIAVHHTETSEGGWDAGLHEKRLRSGEDESYYRRMYAWRDPNADPTTKSAYKFPHHEVSAEGEPGPANLRACSAGIGVLNGGRGGADIPDDDREAVYRHLAAHIRDGGKEPPELLRSRVESVKLRAGLEVVPRTADVEMREVTAVAYSGRPVRRIDPWTGEGYDLVLGLSDGQIRSERLRGLPLLDSHKDFELRNQIGVVERAWIEDGKLMARLRFSPREDVEPIWRDVLAGIIRHVSLGAVIYRREKLDEGTWLATDWEPLELSLVTVPADARAVVLEHDSLGKLRMEEQMNVENKNASPADARAAIASELLQVRRAAIAAGLGEQFADSLCERGLTVEEAQREIFTALARRSETVQIKPHVSFVADETDKRIEAATKCLLHRMRPDRYADDPGAPWRGWKLSRIAEECVRLAGQSPANPNELVRLALTTSDFPNILANVANKVLLDAYEYAQPSYKRWTRRSVAPDFKPLTRVRISEFPPFVQLPEGAEITYGTLSESKETYALATYARGLLISREMIVNDDLGAIDQMLTTVGAAAARLENYTVYSILNTNPTMGDGSNLFSSAHGNVASSGAAISIDTLAAGFAAMMTQKGLDGTTPLNIAPKFLITPVAQWVKAQQFTTREQIFVGRQADYNPFKGMLEPVADAMLDAASTTAWYLAADPSAIPTIEYAYLEGAEGPQIQRVENPEDVLGLKLKVWLDFGAKAIDWRGLYKNAGA